MKTYTIELTNAERIHLLRSVNRDKCKADQKGCGNLPTMAYYNKIYSLQAKLKK